MDDTSTFEPTLTFFHRLRIAFLVIHEPSLVFLQL